MPGELVFVLKSDDLAAKVREANAALSQLRDATRPQAEAAWRQAQTQSAQASRELARRRALLDRRLIAHELVEQAVEAEAIAGSTAEQARLAAKALATGQSQEHVFIERLAAARAQLGHTVVRSQVAGIVLTRAVEPGDLVQPGRMLLEIAREGDTELLVPVDENNLAVLKVGKTAACIADAFPERVFAARIYAIGFVAQLHHLIQAFSALDNVLMPLMVAHGKPSVEFIERGKSLLAQVGLADYGGKKPNELSEGQQQRVAIARALVTRPALLLADEPTGNIDTKTAGDIFALFRRFNAEFKCAVLLVTHDPRQFDDCDRRLTLVDGFLDAERFA